MLAFSSIDTVLIRATGLVVAMFSGLISTGPFMRRGLSEVKIVFFCSVPIVVGGTAGALSAIHLSKVMGATGDAIVRLLLGTILVFIALMFVVGGSKTEYPEPKKYDDIRQETRPLHIILGRIASEGGSFSGRTSSYRFSALLRCGFLTGGLFRSRRWMGGCSGAQPCHGGPPEGLSSL